MPWFEPALRRLSGAGLCLQRLSPWPLSPGISKGGSVCVPQALSPQCKLFRRPVPPSKIMAGTVVVGASSLAYFLGKLSYILGDNCMEKFIKQVYALLPVEALKHVHFAGT